ncbi:MAG: hypothetical protein CVT67_11095 [Actinobacteria bacterium HGW-Actinobacteria-7]|nr:MAG: hypothetical protein CVT67_11095 [Actinobacteria bacterium HGW-Actinobacteria-7]
MYFADKGASTTVLMSQVLVPALLGSAVGGASGVRMAFGFGWYPRWIGGAVLGMVLGLTAVFVVLAAGISAFGA